MRNNSCVEEFFFTKSEQHVNFFIKIGGINISQINQKEQGKHEKNYRQPIIIAALFVMAIMYNIYIIPKMSYILSLVVSLIGCIIVLLGLDKFSIARQADTEENMNQIFNTGLMIAAIGAALTVHPIIVGFIAFAASLFLESAAIGLRNIDQERKNKNNKFDDDCLCSYNRK